MYKNVTHESNNKRLVFLSTHWLTLYTEKEGSLPHMDSLPSERAELGRVPSGEAALAWDLAQGHARA